MCSRKRYEASGQQEIYRNNPLDQQEVGGVLALADLLRNTGSHRHSGNASGTDQGVDLTAGQDIHDLAAENTGSSAEGECDEAQHDDEQGAAVQEGVCRGGAANRCQLD